MSTVVDSKDTVKFVEEEEKKNTSVEEEQEKQDQSAAFDPETGEINWDCPCLGGMADGPCGEEFKAAFSCFVYSDAEPQGIDCVEKFKGMQDCFRRYPEVYASELEDDDEEEEEEEEKEEAEESVVASSPFENSSNSFTSWISSWF